MNETEKRTISVFKALGSPTRYKIIKLLYKNEMCTGEIAQIIRKDKSTTSNHLKILKDLDIVRYITREKYVIYRLKKGNIIDLIKYAEKMFSRR